MATAASLPLEVLTSIFGFLDALNKGRAAQVCTPWRLAADSKSLWQGVEVKLRSKFLNLETSYSIVNRGLKRIRVLDFAPREETCLFKRLIDFIQNVPNVDNLNLTDCLNLSNELLEAMICNLPLLRELNLSGCPRTHNQWLQMMSSSMKSLQTLLLNEYTIRTLNCVADIGGSACSERTEASEEFYRITTFTLVKELECISQTFSDVVSLDFRECILKNNKELRHLPFLEKLESLNLAFSVTLNDDGMRYVTRIRSLKFLDLTACLLITDEGCEFLSQLINLTGLNLSLCLQITDATLKHLSKLASLRQLNLCCCKISDIGLSYLTSDDLKLTELNLSSCYGITDEGILHLCQGSFMLEDLFLSCSSVTNYGISKIVEEFPHLQDLKSTVHFLNHKSLQKIHKHLESFKFNLHYRTYDERIRASENSALLFFISRMYPNLIL